MAENPTETGGMMSTSGLPDWNYETPSSGEGAQGFPDRPVTSDAPAPPAASVPAKVEPGAIQRTDWTGEESQPQGGEDVQLPSSDPGAAFGLGPDLVATWEREGGFQANLERAQATVGKVLSVEGIGDLESKFDGLPRNIQTKVFDVLRLSPSNSPDAALMRVEQIEKSLTPDELATAEKWLKSLTPEQSRALLYGLGNK
jgi:hypothetical protein